MDAFNLSFSEALDALKNGHRVARTGTWPEGCNLHIGPTRILFCYKDASDEWDSPQEDILAEDWVVL